MRLSKEQMRKIKQSLYKILSKNKMSVKKIVKIGNEFIGTLREV